MKTLISTTKVLALSLLFVLGACSSSNDNNNTTVGGGNGGGNNVSLQVQQVNALMQQGSWRVVFYFDTDHEETNNYTGFAFVFNSQGSVAATDGIDTHNGTWLVNNNSNNDGVNFTLNFTSPPNYEELSDDWDVEAYNDTRIELKSVSSGNGGTDELIFEKI